MFAFLFIITVERVRFYHSAQAANQQVKKKPVSDESVYTLFTSVSSILIIKNTAF